MGSVKQSLPLYFILTLLITFSTFEFFFRCKELCLVLFIITSIWFIVNKKPVVSSAVPYIFIFILIYCLQILFIQRYQVTALLSACIILFGTYCVAYILKNNFVHIFIKIIYFISCYSIIIYTLSFIPSIKMALFEISKHFISLNVQDAVQTGGGVNFVIYNFQSDNIISEIGFPRNCGPFWEPGMFAVYISLALFYNIFIQPIKDRYCNMILIITLITTFSTGGYIAGAYLFALYGINKHTSIHIKILLIVSLITLIAYISQLEFIGEKTSQQFSNATYGSDISRFGAFITQIKMIANSPWIGGEDLAEYTTTKTLASGTLMPFVTYGIPLGSLIYLLYYKSCLAFSKHYSRPRAYGVEFFILLIVLSFSQTVLLTAPFYTIMFIGLIINQKVHGYIKAI